LKSGALVVTAAFAAISAFASMAYADGDSRFYNGRFDEQYDGHGHHDDHGQKRNDPGVQLGPRPFYLVEGMDEGRLKDRLMRCEDGPFYRSDFSIGHRGAARCSFPSHQGSARLAHAWRGHRRVRRDSPKTENWCRHDSVIAHHDQYRRHVFECPVHKAVDGTRFEPQCCTSDLHPAGIQDAHRQDGCEQSERTRLRISAAPRWRTDLYTGRGTCSATRKHSAE
jgi:glycerophosphoryl diester phosphodiesterase